jgi:hypothetical protein
MLLLLLLLHECSGLKSTLIHSDLGDICRLPSQHQLLAQHVHLLLLCLLLLLQLLHPVGIPQRIESVLAAGHGRRDVGYHGSLRIACEGILEHLGELAAAEWEMLLLQVESTDALLEGEERLIDFCAIQPRLLVLVYGVRASLRPGKVNKGHLAKVLLRLCLLELQLQDGMRAGRVRVGPGDPGGPRLQTCLDGLHDGLDITHLDLRETDNVHFLLVILSAVHEFSIVEQVVELSAVDLVEGHKQSELGIGLEKVAQVIGCQKVETRIGAILSTHHSESFPRACLAIGEACSLCALEGALNQRLHTGSVDL